MSSRYVLFWSFVGLFVLAPLVVLAQWRTNAARKLAGRLIADLEMNGRRCTGNELEGFVSRLLLSGKLISKLSPTIPGPPIPEAYLQEWAVIERRFKRIRLVLCAVAFIGIIALKELFFVQ